MSSKPSSSRALEVVPTSAEIKISVSYPLSLSKYNAQ